MTDQQPGETQGPVRPPLPLDYQSPQPRRHHWDIIGGAALALLVVLVTVPGAILMAVSRNSGWPAAILLATVAGLLVALALFVQRSPRYHYFGVGIWIGAGVGLLIEGVCFGVSFFGR